MASIRTKARGRSPTAVAAGATVGIVLVAAAFAPWITPQNPFDPAELDLLTAFTPPVWVEGGDWRFVLGTDDQGRDLYSAMLYGARISLLVGFASILLAALVGVPLGLLAGYAGGAVDAVVMRVADIQASFPAILVALLIDGVLRGILPRARHDDLALTFWSSRSAPRRGFSSPAPFEGRPWWRRNRNTFRRRA